MHESNVVKQSHPAKVGKTGKTHGNSTGTWRAGERKIHLSVGNASGVLSMLGLVAIVGLIVAGLSIVGILVAIISKRAAVTQCHRR